MYCLVDKGHTSVKSNNIKKSFDQMAGWLLHILNRAEKKTGNYLLRLLSAQEPYLTCRLFAGWKQRVFFHNSNRIQPTFGSQLNINGQYHQLSFKNVIVTKQANIVVCLKINYNEQVLLFKKINKLKILILSGRCKRKLIKL
jgi:hypothetical protein